MRASVICFYLVFLSLSAHAAPPQPPPLTGHFNFYGLTRKFAVIHLERIYTLFEEGQNREKELRSQGYTCEPYTTNWTACQKMRKDLEIPEQIIKRLSEPHLGQLELVFGEIWAEPELKFSTDFQWSWLINQRVQFNQSFQSHFQYLKMDNNEKIFIGNEEFLLSINTAPHPSLSFLTSITIDDLGSTGYHTYYLELILEKK